MFRCRVKYCVKRKILASRCIPFARVVDLMEGSAPYLQQLEMLPLPSEHGLLQAWHTNWHLSEASRRSRLADGSKPIKSLAL